MTNIPENRILPHPGQILQDEFLTPRKLSQARLAKHIGVHVLEVHNLVRGKRGIDHELATLLAATFGTSSEFWTNLQMQHDLSRG